jgi:acyl-CoA thioesterase I
MQKLWGALIIIGVVFGGFFIAENWFEQKEIKAQRKDFKTIVAFGDSLVQGVGATEGNDLFSQVSKKIGKPIINEGVSGETSAQGLARIQTILNLKPDLVFVVFGGNDVLKRVPKETTFQNLNTIVRQLKNSGAVVVIVGMQSGVLGNPYGDDFEKLAEEHGILYVPNIHDGLIGKPEFMADGIHPNDAGYAKAAEKIYNVIDVLFE